MPLLARMFFMPLFSCLPQCLCTHKHHCALFFFFFFFFFIEPRATCSTRIFCVCFSLPITATLTRLIRFIHDSLPYWSIVSVSLSIRVRCTLRHVVLCDLVDVTECVYLYFVSCRSVIIVRGSVAVKIRQTRARCDEIMSR